MLVRADLAVGVAETDAISEASHFIVVQRFHFGLHLAALLQQYIATDRRFSTSTC